MGIVSKGVCMLMNGVVGVEKAKNIHVNPQQKIEKRIMPQEFKVTAKSQDLLGRYYFFHITFVMDAVNRCMCKRCTFIQFLEEDSTRLL